MTETANITFDELRIVDDNRKGTPDEVRFEEGESYDLPLRSADRWVKRGAAHFTTPEDAAKALGASSDVALNLQDQDRRDPSGTRRQPEAVVGKGADSNGNGSSDLSKKTVAELKALAANFGVDLTGLTTKAEIVAAIERDVQIKSAIAAGNFDDLTVAELQKVAADQDIDLTGKTEKTEIIEAMKSGYKPDFAG
ncbi:Rho termination factor N-terminal domain-containing protein [Bradyrhizobium sp. Leo170]|uniref:Rho termination factor N-terminal domain-containing protein n=1 Tax=Bradyrhizobium sp. Leo170 TaxID=1571199 RepID=UPI00102E915E|nr:Rho termination factor N-terminal domain-containing protein [Bradyrhizobium sp. Leo170]